MGCHAGVVIILLCLASPPKGKGAGCKAGLDPPFRTCFVFLSKKKHEAQSDPDIGGLHGDKTILVISQRYVFQNPVVKREKRKESKILAHDGPLQNALW